MQHYIKNTVPERYIIDVTISVIVYNQKGTCSKRKDPIKADFKKNR